MFRTRHVAATALALALTGCAGTPPPGTSSPSAGAPAPSAMPAPAASGPQPLFVETAFQRTVGPRTPTPAGTIYSIKVIAKAEGNAFRLHRCTADPCKSSTMVAMWKPDAYRSGEELSFKTTEPGIYYLWDQDVRSQKSIQAFANEFVGKRVRITFESGAIIEAWYTLP